MPPARGILSREEPNPYKDHTIIHIPYCTCDLFAGNRAAGDLAFYGYINTRQVLNWVVANFGMTQLSSLVITGSSAGALGAVFWASTIMGELKHTKSTVLADSYVGRFRLVASLGKL